MDSRLDQPGSTVAPQALKQTELSTTECLTTMATDVDRLIKDYPFIRHTLPSLRDGIVALSQELANANKYMGIYQNRRDENQIYLANKTNEYEAKLADLKVEHDFAKDSRDKAVAYSHMLEEKINERDDELEVLSERIDGKHEKIQYLHDIIDEQKEAMAKRDIQLAKSEEAFERQTEITMAMAQTEAEQTEVIRALEESSDATIIREAHLEEKIADQEVKIKRYMWEFSGLEQTIDVNTNDVTSLKQVIDMQKGEIASDEEDIQQLTTEAQDLRERVADKNAQIKNLTAKVDDIDKTVHIKETEKDREVADLNYRIRKLSESMSNLVKSTNDLIEGSTNTVDTQQTYIEGLEKAAGEDNSTIQDLENDVAEKDSVIEALQTQLDQTDVQAFQDLKTNLRDATSMIEVMHALGKQTKATTERLRNEMLNRIQIVAAEAEAKTEIIEDLRRQQKEAQDLAETRMADLIAAQTTIQKLADDYDDLVEKNKIREHRPTVRSDLYHVAGSANGGGSSNLSNLNQATGSASLAGVSQDAAIEIDSETESSSSDFEAEDEGLLNHFLNRLMSATNHSTPSKASFAAELTDVLASVDTENPVSQNPSMNLSDSDDLTIEYEEEDWSESEGESDVPLSEIICYLPSSGDEYAADAENDDDDVQSHISDTDNEDDEDGDHQLEFDARNVNRDIARKFLGFVNGDTPARRVPVPSTQRRNSNVSNCSTQSNDSASQSGNKKRARYDGETEDEGEDDGRDEKRRKTYIREPLSTAEMLETAGERMKAERED